MSVIDEVLAANEAYSRTHELRNLTPCPERKLAVLTCMDTRLSIRTLGLKTGGTAAVAPAYFYAFKDIDENVRQQLQKLRTHAWIPKTIAIRGFVYDVATGLLRE